MCSTGEGNYAVLVVLVLRVDMERWERRSSCLMRMREDHLKKVGSDEDAL